MHRSILLLSLLAGCCLVFFWPLVLHPTWVLYGDHSDIIAEHLPMKRFVVRSYQETGELPLWCPYQYSGMPVVHDIQVQALYPPHWLLLLLPESVVGAGMSWLLVGHVVLAGWAMFAYARHAGLSHTAAFVAGLGYMFAGKWMLHLLLAGHYILIGLAWLPLVVLCLERGIRRSSLGWATVAGLLFSLLVLSTHPQWTFYAGVIAGLWTFGTALERAGYLGGVGERSARRTAAAVGVWLGVGGWACFVAAGLGAAQLLPTLELSRLSSRGEGVETGGGVAQYQSVDAIFGGSPANDEWEERTGLTVLGLGLALFAPLVGGPRARYHFLVTALLFAAAHGVFPFLQSLPGFRLFRLPGRLLIPAAFCVSMLGAEALDVLLKSVPERLRAWCRVLGAGFATLVAWLFVTEILRARPIGREVQFLPYLVWTPMILVVGAELLRHRLRGRPAAPWERTAWPLAILIDLWVIAWPTLDVKPPSFFYTPSDCVRYVAANSRPGDRTLDRGILDIPQTYALGTGAPLAPIHRIETVNGYNPLDVLRFKEYLQFLGDGDDPVVAFNTVFTEPCTLDFPLTNKRLLDLLGVRYVLEPAAPGMRPEPDDSALDDPAWRVVFHDANPRSYSQRLGGVVSLPDYHVVENTAVLPRAFVVTAATSMPPRSEVWDALYSTDFRSTVLLENEEDVGETPYATGEFRAAELVEYLPNRIVVRVPDGPAGWLVLTDVWYPGWESLVNGEEARVRRADFLFRAVPVPAGASEVVFTFEPLSYHRGRLVSAGFLGLVVVVFVAGGVRAWRARIRER